MARLEIIFQAELNIPRPIGLSRDLSECIRRRDIPGRIREAHVLEHVEQLHAKVKVLLLGHVELLPNRAAEVKQARRALGADARASERADRRKTVRALAIIHSRRAEIRRRERTEKLVYVL